jgi:hypothetical protein
VAVLAFVGGALTSLGLVAGYEGGVASYPNEDTLRAVAGWGPLGALALAAAIPAASASVVRRPGLRRGLVLGLGIVAIALLAVAGPVFAHFGTPGPGDPANL